MSATNDKPTKAGRPFKEIARRIDFLEQGAVGVFDLEDFLDVVTDIFGDGSIIVEDLYALTSLPVRSAIKSKLGANRKHTTAQELAHELSGLVNDLRDQQ